MARACIQANLTQKCQTPRVIIHDEPSCGATIDCNCLKSRFQILQNLDMDASGPGMDSSGNMVFRLFVGLKMKHIHTPSHCNTQSNQ